MKTPYVFTCNVTKYKLEYIVDDSNKKIGYLNTILWDYKNAKAFFALLRNSIDKLMNIGVDKISHCVTFNDWEMFLKDKTSWKIIKIDNMTQTYDIECDISNFLINFGIGLGL